VSVTCAWVTSADEAIRGVKIPRRLTAPD
jgi:hypothetical protein